MNEDIIDDIFNDEARNITTQVEVPSGYGRAIVCKTTLVQKSKQIIHKIAVALGQSLMCDAKECNTNENNVFVILIEPLNKVCDANVKRLQNVLQEMIAKDLIAGGFIEIKVYRDVYIYKGDGHVEVDECIYHDTISHNKPMKDYFADVLTREYKPATEKTTIDFPHIIF
jgi:hypothetical protein